MLALYNPQAPTKVSADASSYGMGAVLMQKSGSSWKPIAFASRSMTETERRYAQIEKEALASMWACEKFSTYILGTKFLIETDHKPLVPLLGTKNLDSLPPRVLRFRLRLARFDYSITHVPGKLLYTADALSRAPSSADESDTRLQEEAEALMEVCVAHLPASRERLEEYRSAQATDPICSTVTTANVDGQRTRHEVTNMVKQCPTCARDLTPRKEPMIASQLPDYPWQRVGTDLFYHKGVNYLIVVDYFSRYPEVVKLPSTTSQGIIKALKTMFSRFGVPETVVSDNGRSTHQRSLLNSRNHTISATSLVVLTSHKAMDKQSVLSRL